MATEGPRKRTSPLFYSLRSDRENDPDETILVGAVFLPRRVGPAVVQGVALDVDGLETMRGSAKTTLLRVVQSPGVRAANAG